MNHGDAWDLIPWYVNGSAPDEERAALQLHLEECAQCRAEIGVQRALMQGMRTHPLVEKMPHAAFQKLRSRINEESEAPQVVAAQRPRRPRLVQWLAAAVVLHSVLLGILVVALMQGRNPGSGPYRTVTSDAAPATGPGIRAVFSAELALGDLNHLLGEMKLHITAGPSAEGVFTLAPDEPGNTQPALSALRAHPGVRFAEPLGP